MSIPLPNKKEAETTETTDNERQEEDADEERRRVLRRAGDRLGIREETRRIRFLKKKRDQTNNRGFNGEIIIILKQDRQDKTRPTDWHTDQAKLLSIDY